MIFLPYKTNPLKPDISHFKFMVRNTFKKKALPCLINFHLCSVFLWSFWSRSLISFAFLNHFADSTFTLAEISQTYFKVKYKTLLLINLHVICASLPFFFLFMNPWLLILEIVSLNLKTWTSEVELEKMAMNYS